MATNFPSIQVSQATSKSVTREILSVQFGNGYEQRMPNGINYKRERWSVTWEGLTQADKQVIEAFLDQVDDGSVILWTAPYNTTQKKYALDGDTTIQDQGGNIYTINITLKQVYDLT